jgi:hypothetical protein
MELVLRTGLRIGELADLDAGDVRLTQRTRGSPRARCRRQGGRRARAPSADTSCGYERPAPGAAASGRGRQESSRRARADLVGTTGRRTRARRGRVVRRPGGVGFREGCLSEHVGDRSFAPASLRKLSKANETAPATRHVSGSLTDALADTRLSSKSGVGVSWGRASTVRSAGDRWGGAPTVKPRLALWLTRVEAPWRIGPGRSKGGAAWHGT